MANVRCLVDDFLFLWHQTYGKRFGQIFGGYGRVDVVNDGADFGKSRRYSGLAGNINR